MARQDDNGRAPHRTGRLDHLDAVRALAAMGVIYLHAALSLAGSAHGTEGRILHFFTIDVDPGKIGVLIFFVVSGFIIPSSFKYQAPKRVAVRDFLIGRLFRLYPAYWLSMVAAFFFLFGGSLAKCPPRQILLNITMFQGFAANQNINMIGLYWTLQIEWMFYILCIVLFAWGWLNKPDKVFLTYCAFFVISVLMAVVRFRTHRALPLAAPLGLSVMFSSTLWRMVVLEHRAEAARYMRMAFGSLLAAVPFISMLAYNFDAGHNENWFRYALCYWIAIGLALLLTSRVRLTWRPLVMVGRASFSLYLFSAFFMLLMDRFVSQDWLVGISPHLYILLAVLFSSVLSLPLYEFVEKPCIALGKKLVRRLEYPDRAAVDKAASQYV